MNTNIFPQFAAEYFERGYNVIPCTGKQPMSFVTGWQRWCTERQTQDEFDALVMASRQSTGIAIVCGPISGSVIDVDGESQEILHAMNDTPMARRGMKGWGFHFDFIDLPRQIQAKSTLIDLLTTNSYSLVPPSIHPESGKCYEWLEGCEVVDRTELPSMSPDEVERILTKARELGVIRTGIKKSPNQEQSGLVNTGRNNHLFIVCCARLHECRVLGDPGMKAHIDYLIKYDAKMHAPTPWFTDPKEHHRKSPEQLAEEMYARAAKQMQPVKSEKPVAVINEPAIQPIGNKAPKVPEFGAMALFVDACQNHSGRDIPGIYLSGAISLMAVLTSNKLRLDVTWPNSYLVSLAPSGTGKNTPQEILKYILANSGHDNAGRQLLGTLSYKSANAFYQGISEHRERLDIIDEITALFNEMGTKRGSNDMSGLVEMLCNMWSSSQGYFLGLKAMGENSRVKSVNNPCVNFVGYGVPANMKKALQSRMIEGGLLPRCLFFHDDIVARVKITTRYGVNGLPHEFISRELMEFASRWVNKPRGSTAAFDVAGGAINPENLTVSDLVNTMLIDLKQHEVDTVHELNSGGLQSKDWHLAPIWQRRTEQINKLIIHYCASQDIGEVTVAAVDWAVSVWEYCYRCMLPFIDAAQADGREQTEFQKANTIFKDKARAAKDSGSDGILRSLLWKNQMFRCFQGNALNFNKWVENASQCGWITATQDRSSKPGTVSAYYVLDFDSIFDA